MKVCWLWYYYYYTWNFHPYIHHWWPLAPIVEHYSQEHLLLQRSILTLHYGEAKALHNTPKPSLSLILAKRLVPKSLFYEFWGSIYNKGLGESWHSPLWLFDSPRDPSFSSLNDTLHYIVTIHISVMTLEISLSTNLQIILHFPHEPI